MKCSDEDSSDQVDIATREKSEYPIVLYGIDGG